MGSRKYDIKYDIINCLGLDIYLLPPNELSCFLKKHFSKQYFGKDDLYQMYSSQGFNRHCQIGSFTCCLNLPFPCKLVRGELLSDVDGKIFHHGWIETTYHGIEYVIDTSFARAIPRDFYYQLLRPKIFQSIDRDDLFVNKYASFIKKVLTKKNNLSLDKIYSTWWQYENDWLRNIGDNTLSNKIKKVEYKKEK